MKKIVLSFALACSTVSTAQIQLDAVRFGATGGVNYSRIRHAHNPSGPRIGFNVGVLALIPIDNTDQFYLQPQIMYSSSGESGKDPDAKDAVGYNAMYTNNYISVPIYLKGYFSEAESEFYGLVGPKIGFLMSQKVTNPGKPHYTVEGVDYPGLGNVNGKANSTNFALSLGIGYSYKRKLEVHAIYDWGFSNVYKGLMNEPGTDPNIQKKKTEHVISAGLSYIFD